MKIMPGKRDRILIAAVFFLLFLCAVPLCLRHFRHKKQLMLSVQRNGEELLLVPLSRDAKYEVLDDTAKEVPMETTLASLGEEADPSRHAVNLIEVRKQTARCSESNCSNQICVRTAALSAASYDLPIVCLPHGLVITVKES